MNDRDKFKKLLDEIGIGYTQNGDLLEVDPLHTSGMEDFVIDFYEDGKFRAFGVYTR